jgi:hypothetical protein
MGAWLLKADGTAHFLLHRWTDREISLATREETFALSTLGDTTYPTRRLISSPTASQSCRRLIPTTPRLFKVINSFSPYSSPLRHTEYLSNANTLRASSMWRQTPSQEHLRHQKLTFMIHIC